MQELVRSQANLEAVSDELGRTALLESALLGHLEVVAFLLEAGANVNAQDKV